MITITNLSKVYGNGDAAVCALNNISLTINDGEMIAITGKSGSGKTTLLNLLGGLDVATSGSIKYDDTELSGMRDKALSDFRLQKIGFVFQFYDLLAELTAYENIMLPNRLAGGKHKDISLIAKSLGIFERLHHYPSQLSGGQQQRVAIARALINNPQILLCDEPTGNLDEKSGNEVMELLTDLNRKEKRTILIVTHNPDIAKLCNRNIVLSDGKIQG